MLTENKSVVSNSSPLMNLAIIGQINLLRELFLKIAVPEEVWQELTVKTSPVQMKSCTRRNGLKLSV